MGKRRKGRIHNRSLIGKSEGKGDLKVLSLRGRVTLKRIAKKCDMGWLG
jgi:hypothetical protein